MTLYPPPPGGPQFTAGTAPHGNQATADLDVLITQPLAFCTAGIFARLRQTVAQTLGASGYTALHFDTADEDPYAGWSGSPNWRWMPPAGCSGWYHVTVTASLANASHVEFRPVVAVNGTVLYTLGSMGATSPQLESGGAYVYLFGGVDYVQASVYCGAAAQSTVVTAGEQPMMEISWVSN